MKMFPLHKNETGSFQELAHASDVDFGQLSLLQIMPGCTRGGHYHTRKKEWFCCIHGKCEMKLNNVQDQSTKSIILDESTREFIRVEPYENHVLVNFSSNMVCELLVIISEEFNPDDPDTIKYDSKA
jgi:UDP-2-acetamido-2,6-beta-L-arabino-hexul-4-ose reductase